MISWTKENIDNLIQIICFQKGVNKNDVLSNTRLREIVESRQLIAYFLYMKFEKKSLKKIGDQLGKDHTTIIHSIKRVQILKEVDKDYLDQFYRIEKHVVLMNKKKILKRRNVFSPVSASPKSVILRRTLNRRMRVI